MNIFAHLSVTAYYGMPSLRSAQYYVRLVLKALYTINRYSYLSEFFLYACKRLDVGTIRRKIVNSYIFPLIYRENIHTPTLAGSSRHLPIVKTLAYSRYFHKLYAAGWDYVSNPGKGCDMASPCQADFCKTNNGAPRFQSFLQKELKFLWKTPDKFITTMRRKMFFAAALCCICFRGDGFLREGQS